MTTATAGNVAGPRDKEKEKEKDKDKEKAGMRRALGRGLASLLPGPRMVSPVAPAPQKPPAPPSVAPPADTPRSQVAGVTPVSVAAPTAPSGSVRPPEVAGDTGRQKGAA